MSPILIAELKWYLIRLKKMQPNEVLYRIHQSLWKLFDKYFLFSNRFSKTINKNIDRKHPKPLYESPLTLPVPSDAALSDIIKDKRIVSDECRDILEKRFHIFGKSFFYGNPIDFHLDPATNHTWPLLFWNDIKYRQKNQSSGIKFAWEINRLHHWPKLAIAYRLFKDDKYLFEFITQLSQWLSANPYPKGINCFIGIEVGIRMVNLYLTLAILSLDSSQYEKLLFRQVEKFIATHGRHLYRYPSRHSSAANHALAESLGLFIAGAGFPNFNQAKKWKKRGKHIFENEILRQLYPDGSSFEHSVPYLQFIVDHALVYSWFAKSHHMAINPEIDRRIEKACEFISYIVDIKGNIPMIGDDDDGYLAKLWFGEHNNFISILNSGARQFSRGDWIHPQSKNDLKAACLEKPQDGDQSAPIRHTGKWTNKSRYFDNAGLGIIAAHQDDSNILFVGNSGPLGLAPLSGHGHADALSFWLSVNGCPFFVDPGTYLYHGGGTWRRYFRSTRAHNTIVVDNLDQSEQVADFIFDQFYNIENPKFIEDSDKIIWGGQHDGYKRLKDPVIHAREVAFHKNKKVFYIKDRLLCKYRHEIMLLFHLYPAIKVEYQHQNSFCLSHGATRLELKVHGEYSDKVYKGSENPLFGWYSSGFNRIEETSTIVLSRVIDGETTIESEVVIS